MKKSVLFYYLKQLLIPTIISSIFIIFYHIVQFTTISNETYNIEDLSMNITSFSEQTSLELSNIENILLELKDTIDMYPVIIPQLSSENENIFKDRIDKCSNDKIVCACCGWCDNYDKMKYNKGRPHGLCPQCGAVERHMHACYEFGNKNLLSDKMRFVHFGPQSSMRNSIETYKHVDQIPVDFGAKGYSYNDVYNANVEDLWFSDNFADGIFISHVLEHVLNLDKAIKELHRVLKVGGWLWIEVPCLPNITTVNCVDFDEDDRLKYCKQWDHLFLYDCEDFWSRNEWSKFSCEYVPYSSHIAPGVEEWQFWEKKTLSRNNDNSLFYEGVKLCRKL